MERLSVEVALPGQEDERVHGLRRRGRIEFQHDISARGDDGGSHRVVGIDALVFGGVELHRFDRVG